MAGNLNEQGFKVHWDFQVWQSWMVWTFQTLLLVEKLDLGRGGGGVWPKMNE